MSQGCKARLVVLTSVWKRPVLTRMVMASYQRMRLTLAGEVDLCLLAVGSEGTKSEGLCREAGFDYLEYPNAPLSHKWNAGVQAARGYDADGLVIVGSDDLISAGAFPAYARKLQEGWDFFGLRDLYFLDVGSRQLGYWPGYADGAADMDADRAGEPIGFGRCFSRKLLDRTDWNLWPETPGYDSKLDLAALRFVRTYGFSHEAWTMEELGIRAVDIKAGLNITPFDRYRFQRSWKGPQALAFLGEWLTDRETEELTDPIAWEASA